MTPAENKWVVCWKPNQGARMRLFCFPYAGGSASMFRTWAQNLPPSVEVCAVQLPGRENRFREPPAYQLPPLVEELVEELDPYFAKPFAFFGHSMGAIIGFELARQLRRERNLNLVHLFVSARIAPQAEFPEPPIYQLPEDEFLAKVRELNGTPEEILQNAELWHMLKPILRADFSVNEAYAYTAEDPLDVPISAFGGLEDTRAGQDEMERWAEQTRRSFTLRMLPGDHFFLHSAQSELLQAIAQDLKRFLI